LCPAVRGGGAEAPAVTRPGEVGRTRAKAGGRRAPGERSSTTRQPTGVGLELDCDSLQSNPHGRRGADPRQARESV
jgi:hypothetical protein